MPTRYRKGAPRPSPAAAITAAIIERLEQGVKPWVRPWRLTGQGRPLRACGIPYRGINVFWLWLVADANGYRSPYWMTYCQAHELGGQVRKGETGSIAVFYKSYRPRAAPDDASAGEELEACTRRVLKSYAVFNADQVDGLPERYHPATDENAEEPDGRRHDLDPFFAAVPARLRIQGEEAYYEPLADRITMPSPALFTGYDHYYATLSHELSHWTGHASRLARDLNHRFGTAAYAAEELIAELSSAMLGAELGLPVCHLDHHASYLASWLTLLKADDRAILTAAAKAEEASQMLLLLGGRHPESASASEADDEAEEAAQQKGMAAAGLCAA